LVLVGATDEEVSHTEERAMAGAAALAVGGTAGTYAPECL
jgi:hypothetical protein